MNLARDEFFANTTLAFNQDREMGARDPGNLGAKRLHFRSRADQRCRSVASNGGGRGDPRELQAVALDLENQPADLGRGRQYLRVPVGDRVAGCEHHIECPPALSVGRRYVHRICTGAICCRRRTARATS
jgi:hypothetical protein